MKADERSVGRCVEESCMTVEMKVCVCAWKHGAVFFLFGYYLSEGMLWYLFVISRTIIHI